MTNLLPEEYKKKLRREYNLRLVALSILFLVLAMGLGVITLIPNTVSIGMEYFLGKRIETKPPTSEQQEAEQEAIKTFNTFRDTLTALDPEKQGDEVFLSDLIRLVTQQKPAKVLLASFSFTTESESAKRLLISGLARDRESLVAFSKRLSENSTFSQTDLPISNLSKKENIDFSLTLTVKTKKE